MNLTTEHTDAPATADSLWTCSQNPRGYHFFAPGAAAETVCGYDGCDRTWAELMTTAAPNRRAVR